MGNAVTLAQSLKKFPQHCLRRDRQLMFKTAFSPSLKEALTIERQTVTPEMIQVFLFFYALYYSTEIIHCIHYSVNLVNYFFNIKCK